MPHSSQRRGLSRRLVLLGGLAALAVVSVSCDKPAQLVDHPLDVALITPRTLLARYDGLLATVDGPKAELYTAMRADHEKHVNELTRYIGGASTVAIPTLADLDNLDALRDAESAAFNEAVEQCMVCEDAEYARLLGSIAACRATHVEVLGG